MQHIEIKAHIVDMKSVGCSIYGNPRFELTLETETGEWIYCKTSPNSMIGYAITNYERNTNLLTFVCRKSRQGNYNIVRIVEHW